VGRSRPAIANSMRLLNLSEPVIEMVEKGELSAGHARALIPISDEAQQLSAAKEVLEKNYSVRRTEQMAAKLTRPPKAEKEETSHGVHVDYAAEVSNRLSLALGRKVKLIDGKKSGRIELEFYSADDREALIEALAQLKK